LTQFLFYRSQENENSNESQGDTSSTKNLYQQYETITTRNPSRPF
jgi:hypothetical protein